MVVVMVLSILGLSARPERQQKNNEVMGGEKSLISICLTDSSLALIYNY